MADDYGASVGAGPFGSVTVGGGTASGNIEVAFDRDWFAVTLTQGTYYTFSQNIGGLSDPALTLLDANGIALIGNDDIVINVNFNSQFSYIAGVTGTYYLDAHASAGETGSYTVSVAINPAAPPTDDYGAQAGGFNVGTVAVGGSKAGSLEASGDHDWFAVTLTAGQAYIIKQDGNTLNDPRFTIRDSIGNPILGNDDDPSVPGTLNARLNFTPSVTGTYYIDANSADSGALAIGTYTVSVDFDGDPPPPPVDDFGSLLGAGNLGNITVGGASTTGDLEVGGDHDWFAVTLVAGATYRFNHNAITLEDPRFSLRNSAGTVVASNDDFAIGNFDAQVDYTAPTSGTYYLDANSSDGSDTGTYSVSAIQLNSAPVLDASKSPVLGTINEDAGAPSGAVGTLVSALVDYASPTGQVDNVTDPGGPSLGIALTGTDTANGSWFYSINSGANWSSMGVVNDSNVRFLSADASTRLYFQPSANFSGTVTSAITFRAWDGSFGTNGGLGNPSGSTSVSTASDTASVTVNPINDAPIVANGIADQSSDEDAVWSFTFPSNTFSDIDGDTLSYTATLDSGAALPAWLTFTPATRSFSGTPPLNFNGDIELNVTASDGTATVSDSFTLTVDPVNDAPTSAANTVTTSEDDAYVFAAADFGFADPVEGDGLTAVIITTLPGAGSLNLNGVAIVVGDLPITIVKADIDGSLLTFMPAADEFGDGYASFQFQVQDDGGTANGGIDTSAAYTMTVDVNVDNISPTITDGDSFAFTATDEDAASSGVLVSALLTQVEFADGGDGPGAGIAVTGVSASGTWQYSTDGITWTSFSALSQASALLLEETSQIRYLPDGKDGETATFTFLGWDQATGAASANGTPSYGDAITNGGSTAFSAQSAGATIDVTAIEDVPTIDLNGADSGLDTALTYTENDGLVVIAPAAEANDVDSADLDGGTLTVAFETPVDDNDLLRIVAGGNISLEEGGLLYFGATLIGQVAEGSGGSSPLQIVFNDTATPAMLTEVVRAIGFANFSEAPVAGDRTLVFTVTDGDGGTSVAADAVVSVTSVEDPAEAQDDLIIVSEDFVRDANVFADNGNGDDLDPDGPPFEVTRINGDISRVGTAISVPSGGEFLLNADGSLSFDPQGAYEDLAALEEVTETFSYTITGGDTATVTVTVIGENDAAVFTPSGAEDTAVTEAGGTANATPGDTSAGGQINVADVDNGQGVFVAPASLAGTYGTFTFNAATGEWGYTLDNSRSATEALRAGEVQHDQLTVRSDDGTPYTIDVTVTGSNDAPVVTIAPAAVPTPDYSVNEQQSLDLKGTIAVTDVDAGADEISVTLAVTYGILTVTPGTSGATVAGSGTGTVMITGTLVGILDLLDTNPTSSLAYTANTDAPPSSATLTVTADDGALEHIDTQIITITPLNDAPAGAISAVTGSEDDPYIFSLADFPFSDAEGDDLASVTIASLPTLGTLYFDTDGAGGSAPVPVTAGQTVTAADIAAGKLTFVPVPDTSGAAYASFTFQVRDDGGTANGGIDTDPVANTLTITITPDNRAPNAADDTLGATEDVAVTFTAAQLLGNDSDPDGDTLTITGVGGFSNGTAVLNANGSVTFTPASNFSGVAGFDYTISDGKGGTDSARATVSVASVADAPVAPATNSVNTSEDTPSGPVAIGGSDPDGGPVSYGIKSGAGPTKGSVVFAGDTLTYTPFANANGSDTFTVRIQDTSGASTEQVVSVTIAPVQDAPVAADDAAFTGVDDVLVLTAAQLLANDSDVDGDALAVGAVLNASHGTVSLVGGVITFTPEAGFAGTAGFDYRINDGKGGTDTAHVTVTVTDDNQAPVIAPIAPVMTFEDVSVAIEVDATDADGDALTYSAGAAAHGTISGGADGAFVYTPNAGYVGADSFVVTVSDGQGGTAQRTVTLAVAELADAADWTARTAPGHISQLGGGSGAFFGSNGFEDVTVLDLPGMIAFDPSINRGGDLLRLSGDASDWKIVQLQSSALLSDGDTHLLIPVGTSGITLAFADGARTLVIEDQTMMIGSQSFDDTLVDIIAPGQGTALPGGGNSAAAGVLELTPGAAVTAGGTFDVIGATGNEQLSLLAGSFVLDPSFNKGGDTIVFAQSATSFSAVIVSSGVQLTQGDSEYFIPIGPAGTELSFAGDERDLIYDPDANAVFIGTQEIGFTIIPLTEFG